MAERNELGAHPDGVNPLQQMKYTVKKRERFKKNHSQDAGSYKLRPSAGGEIKTITVGGVIVDGILAIIRGPGKVKLGFSCKRGDKPPPNGKGLLLGFGCAVE
jgi:hypothetical protein